MANEEVVKVLEDMKVKISIPKAAELQRKRNEAIDMAIEALNNSEIPNSSDMISRQAAQERQRVAQKRRYTFGNDEFSLEAAYHDCKLVFDGITDDDSFQEADTGLILYYANEIIYALHEALEGKDTNVLAKDTVYRQDAIDALGEEPFAFGEYEQGLHDQWKSNVENIEQLQSAEPEIIRCKDCKHWEGHVGTIYDGLGKCSFHEGELVKSEGSCYLAERRADE